MSAHDVRLPSREELARLLSDAGVADSDRDAALAHYSRRVAADDGGVRSFADRDAPEPELMLDRLIVAAAGIPRLRRRHEELGVPTAVTTATIRDLSRWTDFFRRERGCPGISSRILGWYQGHIDGRLFEIGRLQFVPARFDGPVRFYRNRRGGELLAFAADGLRVGADGLAPAEGDSCPDCFEATIDLDDHVVTGHPVEPSGHVRRSRLSIASRQWECVLGDGTGVLEVHIPAGRPLDLDECAASMDEAAGLVPRLRDAFQFEAFVCEAWLLDPRLEAALSPTANIVRFARRFYRYTVEADPSEAIWRVFGEAAVSDGVATAGAIASVPRDTGLRRRFAASLESGGLVTAAGGVYFRNDLPFRAGVYESAERE